MNPKSGVQIIQRKGFMDVSYEYVIATWLVADGQTLIAPQYPLRFGEPTMAEPVW